MAPQGMTGTHVGMEEGFGKNSRAFHKQQVLGRWPLPIPISIDVRTGLEFGGVVQSPPKSVVNLGTLSQVLKSDPMWEAADKSMKQTRLTLFAV